MRLGGWLESVDLKMDTEVGDVLYVSCEVIVRCFFRLEKRRECVLQNKPARQCLIDGARVVVQVREGPCLWWRPPIFADGYEHFVRQGQNTCAHLTGHQRIVSHLFSSACQHENKTTM